MKHIFLMVSIMSAAMVMAVDTPNPAKDLVSPAMLTHEQECKKAFDSYQLAIQKANDKAKKDIMTKLAPAMKKGDLSLATDVNKYIEQINSGETMKMYEMTWNLIKKDQDLLGERKGLVIMEAKWGVPGRQADITEILQKKVRNNKLNCAITVAEIGIPDPAFNIVKTVTIKYALNGVISNKTYGEYDTITIK
jgi:hypothetical protein